jgi:hypothetical protein
LPFIAITTTFLSKQCIKRLLDTEMNGYHALFQFYKKTFLRSVAPKATKKVKCSLWSIIETFPREGAWLFKGSTKILRGGAKRSQGKCAPPNTSHQIPAMVSASPALNNPTRPCRLYLCRGRFATIWRFESGIRFLDCGVSDAPIHGFPTCNRASFPAVCCINFVQLFRFSAANSRWTITMHFVS